MGTAHLKIIQHTYTIDKVHYSVLVQKKKGSYMYQQSKGYKICHFLEETCLRMKIYNQNMQQELTENSLWFCQSKSLLNVYICNWASDVTTANWKQYVTVQECKSITYLSPI